jgi:hypothetical protein
LYVLDAAAQITPVPLAEADDWRADTAMAVGASHLYLLDSTAKQIWRYTWAGGGFPGAPEPLLAARASLREAVAISVVGGPVIATSDGRLLRVSDGREQPLSLSALDRPLLAPTAPLINPADGLLYIADRGNQRVVRLSPDGAFRGQLVHHRLAGVQAIALDAPRGALYAIAGQSVLQATIPPP